MAESLKVLCAEIDALIRRNEELEAAALNQQQSNAVALEHENNNLRSIIKILRVKGQELSDAVAPGKHPKEEAKWSSERRAFMEALKISRDAVP